MENNWWYGIPEIEFIWHGAWSDPEICYNDKVINSHIVEETMWERYHEECQERGVESDSPDGFNQYMLAEAEEVKYLIEMAWEDIDKVYIEVDERICQLAFLEDDLRQIDGLDTYCDPLQFDIARRSYMWPQLDAFTTQLLSDVAAEKWDLTDEFEGLCMDRWYAITLICRWAALKNI